jgi:hypothetical protein
MIIRMDWSCSCQRLVRAVGEVSAACPHSTPERRGFADKRLVFEKTELGRVTEWFKADPAAYDHLLNAPQYPVERLSPLPATLIVCQSSLRWHTWVCGRGQYRFNVGEGGRALARSNRVA